MSKPTRPSTISPKVPSQLDPAELETYLQEIVAIIRNAKATVGDRRELVLGLVGRGARRQEMIKLICEPWGIKPGTLDDDIDWAKKYWLNWARDKSREQVMADVEATNEEVIRRGFKTNNLTAVNQANTLRARVRQLVKEGPGEGGAGGAGASDEEIREIIQRRLSQ